MKINFLKIANEISNTVTDTVADTGAKGTTDFNIAGYTYDDLKNLLKGTTSLTSQGVKDYKSIVPDKPSFFDYFTENPVPYLTAGTIGGLGSLKSILDYKKSKQEAEASKNKPVQQNLGTILQSLLN